MEIYSLAIVGAFVSIFVQFIKNTAQLQGWKTIAVLIAASLFVGALYNYLGDTSYWEDFLKVLVSANAVYGLIIKRFE